MQGQPAADDQHTDLAQRGDRLQRRAVLGLQAHHPQALAVQLRRLAVQGGELALLLAEALDHPDPGDGGLDVPD